jgi:hypothetical protein
MLVTSWVCQSVTTLPAGPAWGDAQSLPSKAAHSNPLYKGLKMKPGSHLHLVSYTSNAAPRPCMLPPPVNTTCVTKSTLAVCAHTATVTVTAATT